MHVTGVHFHYSKELSLAAIENELSINKLLLFEKSDTNLSSFNQNTANKKMKDAYYSETSLSDIGSVTSYCC